MFHDFAFDAIRLGDWKYIESNNSYTWPIPLENSKYVTRQYVPKYSPENSDTSIYRLDNWPKLYNIKDHRSESYNIAERNENQRNKMAKMLKEFRNDFLENPRGWIEYEISK